MMGGHTGLKLLVYLFNFLLMLCGIALVVGGTIVQVSFNHYFHGMGVKFFVAPLLLIIAGCVMVLIAAFGCFGVCRLLPWTLILFATLLTTVFLVEISGTIAAYIERATGIRKPYPLNDHMHLLNHIELNMNSSLGDAGTKTPRGEEQKFLWDTVQGNFSCCGVRNYKDWPTEVPDSCCLASLRNITGCAGLAARLKTKCDPPNPQNNCPINAQGCLAAAENFVSQKSWTIGGIGLGVAVFQILGIVLAACLAKKIRNDALNP